MSVQEIAGTKAETTGGSMEQQRPQRWVPVCRVSDLFPERGAAALVEGSQVALVRLLDDSVHAVQQLDPYSGANVISRGIVGSRGDVPTIASPMYKQVFSLLTGECLEAAGYSPRPGHGPHLRTWPVEVVDGVVLVDVDGARAVAVNGSEATDGGEGAAP